MSRSTKATKTNAGLRNLRSLPISDDNMVLYAQRDGQLLASCVIKIPSTNGATVQEFVNYATFQFSQTVSDLAGRPVEYMALTGNTWRDLYKAIVFLIKRKWYN